ncbi:hypothetical protein HXX76_011727 [Chlamydomonas incerta]|uniref:Uncharacterized protein n=1 Tax=Chlamydomonas incerta TaxID=51695 RepID=A0A835SQP5_CHLIN|nr:hypothetical protein HXX76_011727 [Chlamydomonas incerta]|eukprot:KAG2426499.1 hypothetical protein HXX76_011727 [Chlamydomonas incerta]
MLVELGEKRAALLHRLNALLTQRPQMDLEVRRQQLASAAAAARERVQQSERALEAAKREAARLRAANAARRAAAERAAGELAARRAEHQAHHPTLLRYQALTHSHVAAMLLAEQRAKLAALLETLPLRVAAIRHNMPGGGGGGGGSGSSSNSLGALGAGGGGGGGGGGSAGAAASGGSGSGSGSGASPIQVTLCNLKLPDAASVCGLMTQQPDVTSAGLGYLLLLLDLLATYLGGPLLHEGAFQGSTTVLWQQHSFWNRRPSSSNARLPLFLEEGGPGGGLGGGGGGGVSGGGAGPGLVARPRAPLLPPQPSAPVGAGGALAGALSALGRVMTGGGGAAAASAAAAAASSSYGYGYNRSQHEDEALARQRHTDLRLAYDMLLRSLGCFVRDKVLSLGLQLPPGWGPLGWLAVLCATVRREPGTDVVLTAASAALAAAAAAGGGGGDVRGAAAAAWAGPGAGGGGGGGGGGMYGAPDSDTHLARRGDDGDDGGGGPGSEGEEVEEDGWDVVQAPFLPPPPSQPEEVEHWTRAMFTDASRAGGGGGGAGAGGGAAAQAGGAGGAGGGGGGLVVGAGGATALAAALGGSLGSLRRLQGGGGAGPGVGMGPPSMSLERVRSIFGK